MTYSSFHSAAEIVNKYKILERSIEDGERTKIDLSGVEFNRFEKALKPVGFGVWLFAILSVLIAAAMVFNANQPSEQERDQAALKAGLEKIDKGLPLNERETLAIHKFMNGDEPERARRIEKKHRE